MRKIAGLALAGAMTVVSFSAQAATMSFTNITEGVRDLVFGTEALDGVDATPTPFGFDLTDGGALTASESIELYGRIVGSQDVYQFTTDSAFEISFIFDGYFLDADGVEGGAAGAFVSESGFVTEGSSINTSTFSLVEIGGDGTTFTDLIFTSTVSSGPSLLFSGGPGTYSFAIDGSTGPDDGPALYDIEIAAVPLPATLPLAIAGFAGLAYVARRRRNRA
ncbi:MAG: VPLPA-CTERM sorting domain-containing protein [Pseudomonadota bacterium]